MKYIARTTLRVAIALGIAVATLTSGPIAAQEIAGRGNSTGVPAAAPFGVGERAEYEVRLGGIRVGSGSMEVTGMQRIRGVETFHARLQIAGGVPLARVDDKFESWIDPDGVFSRRFKQDQKEIRFRRNRTYDFYPQSRTFRRLDNNEVGRIPTTRPLDDVSFLYYVRTLPLRPGDTYTIPRYFKEDGNPVVIRVLRRETVTVPAGTFETVVVQPIIKTDGLFGEGGSAEVYFSDDDRRILVRMTSRVPIVGSLSLHLREYRPGNPMQIRLPPDHPDVQG